MIFSHDLRVILLILAHKIIRSDEVEAAMLAVDRRHYCPGSPYIDAPQPIGYSVTISAPHMVLFNVLNSLLYLVILEPVPEPSPTTFLQ